MLFCTCVQSDITDVNTIFKDLGMLVHEQGEALGKVCMHTCFINLHVYTYTWVILSVTVRDGSDLRFHST